MKLYFISSCKPIKIEQTRIIQQNAINSWKWLDIDKEILIFNRDNSIKDLCNTLKVNIVDNYESSDFYDLPTWRGMRNYLLNIVSNEDLIVWINADIVLDNSLVKTIQSLKYDYKLNDFILTGRRTNWHNWFELSEPENIYDINSTDIADEWPVDYLIFNNQHFLNMPKFYIARMFFDNYLLNIAVNSTDKTIDCTNSIRSLNQVHLYSDDCDKTYAEWVKDSYYTKEFEINRNICSPTSNINNCKYQIILKDDKVFFK